MMQPVDTLDNIPKRIKKFIEDKTYAQIEDEDVLTKIANYLRTLRENNKNQVGEQEGLL